MQIDAIYRQDVRDNSSNKWVDCFSIDIACIYLKGAEGGVEVVPLTDFEFVFDEWENDGTSGRQSELEEVMEELLGLFEEGDVGESEVDGWDDGEEVEELWSDGRSDLSN